MRQSPQNFWNNIIDKMNQSKLDPYIFVRERVICIAYVNNTPFWLREESKIHKLAAVLCTVGVNIKQ